MPRQQRERRQDESPVRGGATIEGGFADKESGKHYGGIIKDANGNILDQFDEEEENPGIPRPKAKAPDPGDLERAELRKALEQAELDKADAIRQAQDVSDRLAQTQRELEEERAKSKGDEPKADAKKK